MNSIYHILDKHPAIYQEDIQIEYEHLAQELVNSGRLRIDTDYYCNFIHFNDPTDGINVVFSYAELTNPTLVPKSKSILNQLYKAQNKQVSDRKLGAIMIDLNKKIGKLLIVSNELSMQLARIFVQSAHPTLLPGGFYMIK